tara:strand:+ start:1010 stop:1360 length:351 start_codon:yes stop_codon:yes gene_type:complete
MWNLFKIATLVALWVTNRSLIIRTLFLIILFFVTQLLFDKLLNPALEYTTSYYRAMTTIYVILQISYLLIAIWGFRKFIFPKDPEKIISAKKSFESKPDKFEKFKDIKKYPDLNPK